MKVNAVCEPVVLTQNDADMEIRRRAQWTKWTFELVAGGRSTGVNDVSTMLWFALLAEEYGIYHGAEVVR